MPVGGLNFIESTMALPPTDAYQLDNFITRAFGIELRKGWQYWVPEEDNFVDEVRSIFGYNAPDPLNAKLFCSPAIDGAIYEVGLVNAAPTLAITPSTFPTVNGEWSTINFLNTAGSFLLCVCEGAGYYKYDGSTWAEVPTAAGPTNMQFPDATTTKDLVFVFAWKHRVWFLKKNSTVAYYLPTDAITGLTVAFDFGPLLRNGGSLAFATSWTYDAGDGLDDSLVLVGSNGDVLVYQGTDPASANTFSLKGVWYAGRPPYGRRSFCLHGGDVVLITDYGVVSISDLVSGKLHTTSLSGSLGYKINPKLAPIVSLYREDKYWFLIAFPNEEILLLGSPYTDPTSVKRMNFTMNSLLNAWSTMSGIEPLCAVIFNGKMMVGTREGAVIEAFVGHQDGVPADESTAGDYINGVIQTGFNDMGSPDQNKRALRVRIYGLADGVPTLNPKLVSEYDMSVILTQTIVSIDTTTVWDEALWDDPSSIWQYDLASFHKWYGVAAFGKKLSLQLAARGVGKTVLTDYEAVFEVGIGL